MGDLMFRRASRCSCSSCITKFEAPILPHSGSGVRDNGLAFIEYVCPHCKFEWVETAYFPEYDEEGIRERASMLKELFEAFTTCFTARIASGDTFSLEGVAVDSERLVSLRAKFIQNKKKWIEEAREEKVKANRK